MEGLLKIVSFLSLLYYADGFCCSERKNTTWFGGQHHYACFLKFEDYNTSCSTVIAEIRAFSIQGQSRVNYLLTSVGERFPELRLYDAGSCSIKAISKAHFKKMTKLETLFLGYNQIEEVPGNTFEDCKNLINLFIGKSLDVVLETN